MTKVLIVEDQRMAQENMESIIKASANYTLVGIISNAADAELFCMREHVDLVLMDVCTSHDENGIEACAVIKKKFKKIKVIIVTSMAEHTFIERAKKANADSFWYKVAEEDVIYRVPQLGHQQNHSGGGCGNANIRQKGFHITGVTPEDVLSQEEQAVGKPLPRRGLKGMFHGHFPRLSISSRTFL